MASSDDPSLKRSLGLKDALFFGFGTMLGAGIYTIIGAAAGEAGNMLWLSFLIAAGAAMLSAFRPDGYHQFNRRPILIVVQRSNDKVSLYNRR